MNREILFRGKRTDSGEWVEGAGINRLVDTKGKEHIYIAKPNRTNTAIMWIEVIPETVGEYAGLTDKNGKKMFEGDIIRKRVPTYKLGIHEPVGEQMLTGVLIWKNEDKSYPGSWLLKTPDTFGNITNYYFDNKFEVIGNIHDNPDLLEWRG